MAAGDIIGWNSQPPRCLAVSGLSLNRLCEDTGGRRDIKSSSGFSSKLCSMLISPESKPKDGTVNSFFEGDLPKVWCWCSRWFWMIAWLIGVVCFHSRGSCFLCPASDPQVEMRLPDSPEAWCRKSRLRFSTPFLLFAMLVLPDHLKFKKSSVAKIMRFKLQARDFDFYGPFKKRWRNYLPSRVYSWLT